MPPNSIRGGRSTKIAAIGAASTRKRADLAGARTTGAGLADSATRLFRARSERGVGRLRQHVRISPAILAGLRALDGEESARATSPDGRAPPSAAPASGHRSPAGVVAEAFPADAHRTAPRPPF